MEEPSTSLAPGDPQPEAAPVVAAAADAAYGETWFTATGRDLARPRPPLTHDIDVDICIIGGGLAGLTTAYEAARKGWSVAVLERRRVAWNASSRNTGFVRPGFGLTARKLVERVGADQARDLWMLSQDGIEYVRRTAGHNGMPDIVQSEGWLHISKTDRVHQISDEAEMLRGLGADIEVWPANLVRAKVKSPYYFQAIHFPTAFNIQPYNYALGLARLAEDAGARIFEDTAALSIDPEGVRKRLVTQHGRVRAAHLVFAGSIHLGPIIPEIADTLVALHTFAVVTKPLGDNLASAIEYPGAVSDTDFADHHYRIVGGDRLMFAGRVATRESNPRRYGRRLNADLRRRFPQLGPVEIEHAWTGAVGATVHGMPQVGRLGPGVWLASGFGGHGLNTTAMAATLITGAITEGDDRYRLFEPFELIWAGGRMGRVVAKHYCSAYRVYEQWASRRARRNELWWIENEPRLKKEAEEAAEQAKIRAEQAVVAEAERIERKKIEAEQAELRRIERERIAAEKAEAKRIRAEEKAAAKAEAARLKEERRAAERAEKERIAAEKAEAKRLEAERIAAERAEADRIAAERQAAERAEADQIEAAHRVAEQVAANAARLAAGMSHANATAAQDAGEATPAVPTAVVDDRSADVPAESAESKADEVAQPKPQGLRGFWRRD